MIRLSARSVKAVAVLAIGFLIAGVSFTAASATDTNQTAYWNATYPNVGECVKYDPPGTANSYGYLSADNKSVILNANQALLVVKGGDGYNVFENPVAGMSYQSPLNGGDTVPDVSHWIVCGYKTLVTPAVLTTDDCGLDNATLAGVANDKITWSAVTTDPDGTLRITATLKDASTYTFGQNQSVFTYKDNGVLCDVPPTTHFMTIIWNMNPNGTPPVFDPAQTIVDSTQTDAPDLGAFDDLLVGKCVGFQVDVYKYTLADDIAAVDHLIDVGVLTGPGNPPEPLIAGGLGTAWKFYQNSDCAQPVVVPVALNVDDQCGVDNDAITGVPDNSRYSDVMVNGNVQTVTFTPGEGETLGEDLPAGWTANDEGGAVFSHTFTNEACPVELTKATPADPTVVPFCGPNNNTVTIPTTTGVTYSDTGWSGGERTITATANMGYVLDGKSEWTFTDDATLCPIEITETDVTPNPPTVVPACFPNNDAVTIPTTTGVIYTDSGWILGVRTITAAAAEGYALIGTKSWTFTDVPSAGCPAVPTGFAFIPTAVVPTALASTGTSSDTGGYIGLALFLIASGTVLVSRKVRAQ